MIRPGFVDLQVNGYFGVDFSDPAATVEQILEAAELLVTQGTVGFLATIITGPRESMEMCAKNIAEAIDRQGRRGPILGIHLEGPFISPDYGYHGMHDPQYVCPPDAQWFERLQKISRNNIRIVTLAPEYEGACEFVSAVGPSVTVSAGHTHCSFSQARRAVRSGLRMATHIGNGCRQEIDRHDNPIVNLLGCGEIAVSFIPDGFHLPEAFLRMLLLSRPINQLIAISDSSQYAGMAAGTYTMSSGLKVVLSENGRLATVSDANVLAGSSSTMLRCMNHLASLGVLTAEELWQIGFGNPLSAIGGKLEELGSVVTRVEFDEGKGRFRLA
ncbi:MAG TPA: N-acetylglucosamine-6-phosphate deacetylase [Bacteroidota bacterium]|nr:N-acetylglucosamine-6-phosphate deacetylase [Bacteroidota bacterium]